MKADTTAVYVRISSDHQDRASQRTAIRNYLTQNSIEVPKDNWHEDTGSRIDADRRPAFQRLIAAVEAGHVKKIIVLALDRFGTADVFEQIFYLRKLHLAGCELLSVTEANLGNLARPDMATTLMTTVASARSTDELQARSRRDIQGKVIGAKRGYSPGGLPAFGYDWLCVDSQGREKWRLFYVGFSGKKLDESNQQVFDKKNRPLSLLHRVRIWPDGRREDVIGDKEVGRDTGEKLILAPTPRRGRLQSNSPRWARSRPRRRARSTRSTSAASSRMRRTARAAWFTTSKVRGITTSIRAVRLFPSKRLV
jgi:DNA invertase Pin-like site-specific DNA recombinase